MFLNVTSQDLSEYSTRGKVVTHTLASVCHVLGWSAALINSVSHLFSGVLLSVLV